ncbi:MAG TPA: deoxyguanosinetriphosphate triphosphohydrolase [Candidatus Polarisedimenticolaceae bacterium]|nr:deoxyguanosinetriphosphate triphosphohydrolase [Candidatus Polarisedimenticolaceae bacterium]
MAILPRTARVEASLAPYAQTSARSRGRRHREDDHGYRSAYQRDRDRIIHSRAFRRLEYKTQVFVNHEGDHYRTRLTHSIEVSQIGRTVARSLALNEDLVESLSLSHDLGHTPFGHLGEDVLDEFMRGHGGFSHNRQTLRIVEHLEERYPAFLGLNLTWEVREGIAKHSGPIDVASAPEFSEYEPARQPPLEAQLIDLVDEIAYNHHDIDDGLSSGLLDPDALAAAVPLFGGPLARAAKQWPAADPRQLHTAALRGLVDGLVTDLIETTESNVAGSGIATLEEVRAAERPLAALSPEVAEQNRGLKGYLRTHLYHHHRIERMKDKARRILRALAERYLENPLLLPDDARRRAPAEGLHRAIADYIAGMTDRYANEEYQRLFDPAARV